MLSNVSSTRQQENQTAQRRRRRIIRVIVLTALFLLQVHMATRINHRIRVAANADMAPSANQSARAQNDVASARY